MKELEFTFDKETKLFAEKVKEVKEELTEESSVSEEVDPSIAKNATNESKVQKTHIAKEELTEEEKKAIEESEANLIQGG